MGLVGVVANAHRVGEHVGYVALLLGALEQVRVRAGCEDGHVAAVVEGLFLMNGRELDVVGRVG